MYRMVEAALLQQEAAPTLRIVEEDTESPDETAEDMAAAKIGQLDRLVYGLQNWNTPQERLFRAKMCADHTAGLVRWLETYCAL